MSIRTMTTVWDKSQHSGSNLLMLLAIADFSDDDGRAYPSVGTLARKCRMKERNAQYILSELIASGELTTQRGNGPRGCNVYKIKLAALGVQQSAPLQSIAPVHQSAPPPCTVVHITPAPECTQTTIEPSMNHQCGSDTVLKSRPRKESLACPVEELIELYHQSMPTNPRCKVISQVRRSAIKARWLEAARLGCAPFGYDTRAKGIDAWRIFFETCAESDFLTGRVSSQGGRPPFMADIDFLLSPKGFTGCLENKYHRSTK